MNYMKSFNFMITLSLFLVIAGGGKAHADDMSNAILVLKECMESQIGSDRRIEYDKSHIPISGEKFELSHADKLNKITFKAKLVAELTIRDKTENNAGWDELKVSFYAEKRFHSKYGINALLITENNQTWPFSRRFNCFVPDKN